MMTLHGDERDFADEVEPREFEIGDFTFEYEPLTPWEKLNYSHIYMDPNGLGGKEISWGKYGLVTACKIKAVPWGRDKLKEMAGVDKEWAGMTFHERLEVITQLNEDLQKEVAENIIKKEVIKKQEVDGAKKE